MKLRHTFSVFIALSLLTTSFSAKAQEEISPMCSNELEQLEAIESQGIENRFVIPTEWEIEPEGRYRVGKATLNQFENELILYQGECPGDRIPSDSSFNGGIVPFMLWQDGSIIRYRGSHMLGGFTFSSEEEEALAFILLRGHGMVYLHGSGQLTTPNGSEIKFPREL